eukprot:jgi/Ulvmu1/5409/UM022_0204.1
MKQYFVAVGCPQSKLITLVDLLNVVAAEGCGRRAVSIGIAASSRDALDELSHGLNNQGTNIRLGCWHADMPEESLAQVTRMVQDNNLPSTNLTFPEEKEHSDGRFVHPDDTRDEQQNAEQQSEATVGAPTVLICTDAAMQMVPKHVLPLKAQLLVNYDLPTSRDQHQRRMATILGSTEDNSPEPLAAIHFVVAGQMAAFRALEKVAGGPLYEMPVHAADILRT